MSQPLLRLKNLHVTFKVRRGGWRQGHALLKAVTGVSLDVFPGEVLGLVGESGCGKTTLGRAILHLEDIAQGSVQFEGRDLALLTDAELRPIRPRLQMIFQDPYASLNPRMTVFDILAEPLFTHAIVPRADIPKAVITLMEKVGLAPRYMRKYPHEFSGGQRQRVAIARTLALKPKVIIADEPVSALDVSVQAQILNLLEQLCAEEELTMIFISHDLSVVRRLADRIAVMYLGHIVELGSAQTVMSTPAHPYTKALLSAIPAPDPVEAKRAQRIMLEGEPPSPIDPPQGCPFHPRCPLAGSECRQAMPAFQSVGHGHEAACIKVGERAES